MRRALITAVVVFAAAPVMAQEPSLLDLIPDDQGTFSGRIIQGLVILTVLSLAPGLLITTTCFTRFVIAFSFLRSGLGLQSTPSNLIVISLAIFMTYFVMEPVFNQSWREGVRPLMENEIGQEEAFGKITDPLKAFMMKHVRDTDLALFENFKNRDGVAGPGETGDEQSEASAFPDEPELSTVIPAYMLSELRRAFEIGFLILLPFLVIDLVVATVTMSMGMMMLPPTVVALPFKVLFFVLIDGWNLIVGELLESVV